MILSKGLSVFLWASFCGAHAHTMGTRGSSWEAKQEAAQSFVRPQGIERGLQTDSEDPCEGIAGENMFWPSPGLSLFVPSYYEGCINSLELNATNVLQHLYALNGTFSEYYAFYNIAKDPAVSFPQSYQPELGYSLFGENEGQVDLAAQMDDLYSDVYYNGANASVFWSMTDIFTDLRDAHVVLPQLNEEFGDVLTYAMLVSPERVLKGGLEMQPQFSLLPDGTFELKIYWLDLTDDSVTFNTVETIAGLSVTDFVLFMANTRALGRPYQALGTRVNAMLKSPLFAPKVFSWGIFEQIFTTTPSHVLPDVFSVTYSYSDGSTSDELWYTGIYEPSLTEFLTTEATSEFPDLPMTFNRSGIEEILTHPGKARANYDTLLEWEDKSVEYAFDTRAANEGLKGKTVVTSSTAAQTRQADVNEDIIFKACDSCVRDDGTVLAAYGFEDDYAVLKIETFNMLPDVVMDVWTEMVIDSQEKGVKKLMIDISGNGGGIIISGLAFSVLMFPNVAYSWFDGHADLTYNKQMRVFLENVLPVVDGLEDMIESFTDGELEGLIQDLEDEMSSLIIMSATMFLFCRDNCELHPDFTTSTDCACAEHYELFQTTSNFVDDARNTTTPLEQTVEMFRDVLGNLTNFIREVNPWTVTQGGGRVLVSGRETVKNSVIRGGQQYYLTDDYAFLPETCDRSYWCFEGFRDKALALDFVFDEYMLLSDGAAGSTTNIFASSVEQIWKNRDRSFANSSVVTVAYGGTGNSEDITLAGFPASVQHVRMENPLLTRSALLLFVILLNDVLFKDENAAFGNVLLEAQSSFASTLHYPPYFADSLPYIPVVNYYDPFMGPDALPLQYIKMPPDEYIPKLYTRNRFGDARELPALYKEASLFFTPDTTSVSKFTAKKSAQETNRDKAEFSRTFEDSIVETAASGGRASVLLHSGCAFLVWIVTSWALA